MRILRLKLLDRFKILPAGFEITFEQKNNLNILIGNNGSGKSTVIECLSLIFADLYKKSISIFGYELVYLHGSIEVKMINRYERLNNDVSKVWQECYVNRQKISFNEFRLKYLPANVIAYYSGQANYLKDIYEPFKTYANKYFLQNVSSDLGKLRPMFLLEESHSQLAFMLLIILKSELINLIKIEKIHSVDFLIKNKLPKWANPNDRLFGATGGYRYFLEYLIFNSTNHDLARHIEFIGNDILKINKIDIDIKLLFALLEGLTQPNGLFDHVNIKINKKHGDSINFKDLSDGEKQLINILGFIEITQDRNTLFLLDEPDVFLHPKWQRILAEKISTMNFEGQVIMTTHSPLSLSEVHNDAVYIMKNGDWAQPSTDTYQCEAGDNLNLVMKVTERPEKTEELIRKFYDTVSDNKTSDAKSYYKKIEEQNARDPFLLRARGIIKRMEILDAKN